MLKEIRIKNLAIIDEIKLDFGPSFNVLSGRSGSGKTIIYKSINYLLGSKFDKNDIRKGEKRCEVQGSLEIDSNLILLRRVFSDTRTENFIDNQKCTYKDYVDVTRSLWESYGQHEQQMLLDEKNHLSYLDLYAGNNLSMINYLDLFEQYVKIKKEVEHVVDMCADYEKNKELYVYQHNELVNFEVTLGEDLDIKDSIDNIRKSKDVYDALASLSILDSSIKGTVDSFLSRTVDKSENTSLNELNERLTALLEEISDIEYQSSLLANDFYYDFKELQRLEDRLLKINELKRKYGGTIESIIEYKNKLEDLINNSVDFEKKISNMNKQKQDYKLKLETLAKDIHNKRISAAKSLESNIINDLESMDMMSVDFSVDLGDIVLNERAIDKCEFHIRTNKGESIKSISKIVSGGELSRIMMSIKLSINSQSTNKVFLLDEIDSGLSGVEAESLGNVICRLAESNQIICITHLSQIASKADSHIKTSKNVVGDRTFCHAEVLSEDESVSELAAMISGKKITKSSVEYAKGISKN